MAKDRTLYQRALRYGHASNREERWQEAANAFKIAIREFPGEPEAYGGLGDALFGLRQLEKALDCYKIAARFSNGNYTYLQKVADIQERLGQLSEASRTYMAAGEILLRQRDLDTAIANWQRAVRLNPGLLGAHQRLATVFQRQDDIKAAVREYLAIARILQMRGEEAKALTMCQAALRLDPGNEDVVMAMQLIRRGVEAVEEPEPEPVIVPLPPEPEPEAAALAGSMVEAVRKMADAFESEKQEWELPKVQHPVQDPIEAARRLAQDQLAEEIFREEEDEDLLYGTRDGGLSKLERDALVGQGMDFQLRGRVKEAIGCYERAASGGLDVAAIHFTLGMLYLDLKELSPARRALARAAKDAAYQAPIRLVMNEIS